MPCGKISLNSPRPSKRLRGPGSAGTIAVNAIKPVAETRQRVRKLIAFDDDTFDKLKQLGRDRMATLQELADEAFTDLLRKHNIPIDLKDALRKSAAEPKTSAKKSAKPSAKSSTRKPKS
jgi:non-homologous end joining protein Ku